MKLTKKKVAEFAGRNMKIQRQNEDENYLYQGQIKSATLDKYDILLIVEFNLLAKRKDHKWIKEDKFASDALVRKLQPYSISEEDNGLFRLYNPTKKELLTIFPKNSRDNLNPAEVKKLRLPKEKVAA